MHNLVSSEDILIKRDVWVWQSVLWMCKNTYRLLYY